MAKFIVQRTIRHHVKDVVVDSETDSVIELSDADAAQLLACGAVIAAPEPETKKKKADE